MTAMTTVLTEFSSERNSRTSTLTGHTAVKPKLVIEKRDVPEGNKIMCVQSFKVIFATEDVNGVVLSEKIAIEGSARYPKTGSVADVEAALVFAADIFIGDEWKNSITTQEWL